MKKSDKKIIFIFVGFVLAIFILSGVLAYFLPFHDPVSNFFKKIYPAAVVWPNYISIQEWEEQIQLARQLDSTASKQAVFDQLVKIKKEQAILHKLHVAIESDSMPDESAHVIKGKNAEYENILKNYFLNDTGFFESAVIWPRVFESNLRIKYNSDFQRNEAAYQKINDILRRIKSGEKFEDLAKNESNDRLSGQLGGDLGFFEHGEILPELEREIAIRPLGKVYDQVVVSRLGYHIIYPIETATKDGKKLWHAKHILIETDGFDQWLVQQLDKYKVWQIVNI
jgi:parvulin-like peptidyl-prolyl isomerase